MPVFQPAQAEGGAPYHGFATQVLWPLLHNQIPDRPAGGRGADGKVVPSLWKAYVTINELFAADLTIPPGLRLDRHDLAEWLARLAYRERDRARGSGEFAIEPNAITLIEHQGAFAGRTVRVVFEPDPDGRDHVAAIEVPPSGYTETAGGPAPLSSPRERSAQASARAPAHDSETGGNGGARGRRPPILRAPGH